MSGEKTRPGNRAVVYERPAFLADLSTAYCPGCTHGTAHRLIAEVIGEMGLEERIVGVASVGCSVFSYEYFRCDFIGAAHGRAAASATGIKRLLPEKIIFTYQGDGDLASIGIGETLHAAVRGEKITIIFVNNAVYGMTGGQMAPTTLPGQKTSSSPKGRNPEMTGQPLRVAELLASIDGVAYCARRSLHDDKNIRTAKKAIRLAFEAQARGLGFSIVELLSTCPTNWGMTPAAASKWVETEMLQAFPLGEFKRHSGLTKGSE